MSFWRRWDCINTSHDSHDRAFLATALSEAIRTRYSELSEQGLRSFHYLPMHRSEGSYFVLCSTVYSTETRYVPAKFRKHSDPNTSAHHFIKHSENTELLFYQKLPYSIGILSFAGKEIIQLLKVDNALIDRTFKPNIKSLEPFNIII